MIRKETKRVTAREGYDLWANTYDQTPNPVVAMDSRHTMSLLNPQPGQKILDAGCGTGRNLARISRAGARPYGLDFSLGMLRVAKPRWTLENRPWADTSKPANGAEPEQQYLYPA